MIDEIVVPIDANSDASSEASRRSWGSCSGVDMAVAGLTGWAREVGGFLVSMAMLALLGEPGLLVAED